jgi:2-succinyl-5-enolpyruvyl-6-hydroxy-3-cyclohexene-1-carboxylate synthase
VWFSVAVTITATATFCATITDQWALMGTTDAFIAPGSRSTPLALALVADERIATHLVHDERSASFACLGHGLATGRPAILLCTSGTAATHFHGAVAEADASRVPMLVCTADRPPELWGIGAPQTIDQTDLYGEAVRGFVEPGPPDDPEVDPATWRPMAADAWAAAVGAVDSLPGPVHLNLSFRDPLVGEPDVLPPLIPAAGQESNSHVDDDFPAVDLPERGVIVAGRSSAAPDDVFALAAATGWPILADARSGCRRPGASVSRFDSLLRSPTFAEAMRPDMIVRIGEPPASKVLGQWIVSSARAGADVLALTDGGQLIDPERVASAVLPVGSALPRFVQLAGSRPSSSAPFAEQWLAADRTAEATINELLHDTISEPAVARDLTGGLAAGTALVVSSSMPIRDVEWFGTARDDIEVFANRGANGIDGVTSTAIGIALTGRPTAVLIGDVAFLHDSSALIGLRQRSIDLTIIVIDNDGGGIFSFLPQHGILPAADYEFLFGTPHGTDLSMLCDAHGIGSGPWDPDALVTPGVHVLIAETNRAENLDLHDRLVTEVITAIERDQTPGS